MATPLLPIHNLITVLSFRVIVHLLFLLHLLILNNVFQTSLTASICVYFMDYVCYV